MTTVVVNVKHRPRPAYDHYVGRYFPGIGSSSWGNPFLAGKHGTNEEVTALYRQWLAGRDDFPGYRDVWRLKPERRAWILAHVHTLRGKTLACSCKPDACHGDVLAELADTRQAGANDR